MRREDRYWSEIGIDSDYLDLQLERISKKRKKTTGRFIHDQSFMGYITRKFRLPSDDPLTKFFNEHYDKYRAAYFFARTIKKFDPEIVKDYYEKLISENNEEKGILRMLFEVYLGNP
ncbi:MAG: hypothetical protein V1909_04210, partial [Candidatus Micrarchaeota archaeon]